MNPETKELPQLTYLGWCRTHGEISRKVQDARGVMEAVIAHTRYHDYQCENVFITFIGAENDPTTEIH